MSDEEMLSALYPQTDWSIDSILLPLSDHRHLVDYSVTVH